MSASPSRRYSRGVALDWFFFVFAGFLTVLLTSSALETLRGAWGAAAGWVRHRPNVLKPWGGACEPGHFLV